jgi:leader peptidase (prepilin peptidase) / N-methyltransferase
LIEILARAAAGVVLGSVLGSFVTNWGVRAARGEQAFSGRSHCDACQAPLTFAQTAPILSFALLRGRCKSCGVRIDAAHPLGETAGAMIGLFALLAPSLPEAALRAALGFSIMAAAVIDAKTLRLPNSLTLVAALLALGLALERDQLIEGLAAAVIIGAVLAGLRRAVRSGSTPGLGLGDVKLAAALALWLGAASSWMLVLASGLGLIAIRLRRPTGGKLAFGPWIAVAAYVVGFAREWNGWTALI